MTSQYSRLPASLALPPSYDNFHSQIPNEGEHNSHRTGSISLELAYREDEYTRKLHLEADEIPPSNGGAPRTLHPNGWLYEILSLGLALVSLLVLVPILLVYDTRPTPAWVGGLTLNTILSIVSLTFRFGLMVPVGACISQLAWIGLAQGGRPLHDVVRYDWASRSPWGSAALLFKTPNQSRLGMLGALLVLLALIVGPFFQQSVAYFDEVLETRNTSAYVSVALSYTSISSLEDRVGTTKGDSVSSDMRSAIYTGLLSYGQSGQSQAPFYCPHKADCHWYNVPTLALEAQCGNLDAGYTLQCSRSSREWPQESFPDHCSVKGYLASNASYDPTRTMSLRAAVRQASTLKNTYWTLPSTGNRSVDVAFLEVEWFVARSVAQSTSPGGPTYVDEKSRVEGRRCILYSVAAEITPEVKDGIYSERVYDTSMIYTPEEDATPGARPQRLLYHANKLCNSADKTRGCSTESLKYPVKLSVGVDDYIDLLAAISEPLGGGELLQLNSRTRNSQEVLRFLEVTSQSNNQSWSPMNQNPRLTPSYVNITSVTQLALYNTVRHINIALRSNNTPMEKSLYTEQEKTTIPPVYKVTGIVMIETPHIKVRWPWLAFPSLLILGTVILLWSTIIECEFDGVPLWKDNPLAIVMHTNWRRPPGSRVLKTTGHLTETSKNLKAGYIGNVHAEEVAIVIAENEQNHGVIEMAQTPDPRSKGITRRRMWRSRKDRKDRHLWDR